MKKIMFNDRFGLTQAVLDGKKTQTRRIPKIQQPSDDWELAVCVDMSEPGDPGYGKYCWVKKDDPKQYTKWIIPAYWSGDVVALLQRYSDIWNLSAEEIDVQKHQMSDGRMVSFSEKGVGNKMFTKPEYMPHQIKITDVHVRHLQDISDEDCLAEGIKAHKMPFYVGKGKPLDWRKMYYIEGLKAKVGDVFESHTGTKMFRTPREAYAALVDKINGKGTWKSNPWVWVYEFKLIK